MGRQPGHHHDGTRRPAYGRGLLLTHSCSGERPQSVCVCWRGADYVPGSALFQPAFGCMGRWPGHRIHAGAPPPRVRVGGSCAHTPAQWSGHKPCACAGAAQGMFDRATSFNQPLEAWDVSRVTDMHVRRRPASQSGLLRAHSCSDERPQAVCVCWRSLCSARRLLSTSLWLHGTSARLLTWRCAAALRQGLGAHAHTQLLRGAATSRVRVLAWCS